LNNLNISDIVICIKELKSNIVFGGWWEATVNSKWIVTSINQSLIKIQNIKTSQISLIEFELFKSHFKCIDNIRQSKLNKLLRKK
jgi:hypothetical protein